MSIKPTYKNQDEKNKAGWFSRRHPTNKEHKEAQERRKFRQMVKGTADAKKGGVFGAGVLGILNAI